jgi:hypothetical protein
VHQVVSAFGDGVDERGNARNTDLEAAVEGNVDLGNGAQPAVDIGVGSDYLDIAAYWTGHHRAALDACDRLLTMSSLPAAYREQTKANRAYCVSALGQNAPGRVTTTGDIPSVISPVAPR